MPPSINRLRFSGDGSFLFQGDWESVRSWHNHQFVQECPGRLVGVARDDQTFLTYDKTNKSFSAWQSATGTQIKLSALSPDDYAANQRCLIEGNGLTLTFHDALGLEPPRTQTMSQEEYSTCDNWSLSSGGDLLVVAFYLDVEGHDSAWGECFERDETGTYKKKFGFGVDRFAFTPVVTFCEPHPLLAVSTYNAISLLLTNDGTRTHEFKGSGGFAAVSPVKRDVILLGSRLHTWQLYKGEQKQSIQEEQEILAGVFHPTGDHFAILLKDQTIRIYDVATLALADELRVTSG